MDSPRFCRRQSITLRQAQGERISGSVSVGLRKLSANLPEPWAESWLYECGTVGAISEA